MSINALINELKENNQDFEFYPTSKEMLQTIEPYMDNETVLDIGCGNCNFKKYLGHKIKKYYVIEKSKILLKQLDTDTICLGTDFQSNTLIDKKVTTIFCNPPYSEFTEWTHRIISEGNFIQAFLIIPERWKNNTETLNLLDFYNIRHSVIGSFDFLDAERKARAKADIVRLYKKRYDNIRSLRKEEYMQDFDIEAFDGYFQKTFRVKTSRESDYQREERLRKEKEQTITTALSSQKGSKAEILVNLYENEYKTLVGHLNLIMQLDERVLESFGFSVEKVKEGLKSQISGMKYRYWHRVMNEMEEITERLTNESRNALMDKFKELYCIDFTLDNIYALILWVVKNANKYYNSQLISFFKKLSDESNVKPYKSNKKLFEKDGWRWSSTNKTHYILDYRIIMSSPFRVKWSGELDADDYNGGQTLSDIKTIANNLGFNTKEHNYPATFGEKAYIYNKNGKPLAEYKVYKNGNMHVKFDIEFTKAMNVEVSRLLGWIRTKEDIKKEFPVQMAKGAEKYFKTNYTCLNTNSIPLLTSKKSDYSANKDELSIIFNQPYTNCLDMILNNIDNFNDIISDNNLISKCLNILKTQQGFIYRNCLISKQDNKTKVEFREITDFNNFENLLKAV